MDLNSEHNVPFMYEIKTGEEMIRLEEQNEVDLHHITEHIEIEEPIPEALGRRLSLARPVQDVKLEHRAMELMVPKVSPRKPRARQKKNLNPVTKNKKSYNHKWLKNSKLRPWLVIIPDKPNLVLCKWCKQVLRAHLHDLKLHSNTRKHKQHSLLYDSGEAMYRSEAVEDYGGIFDPSNLTDAGNSENKNENSITTMQDYVNISLGDGRDTSSNLDTTARPAKLGFIGSGNMAQALLGGFLKNGLAEASNVIVSAPSYKNLKKLEGLGVQTTNDNNLVLNKSDVVFLCVKPHLIGDVVTSLELEDEEEHNPLFVSVMAGVSLESLEGMLDHIIAEPRVIRIMPNTPCMVLTGCAVYCRGTNVNESEGNMIKCLMSSIGLCEEIPESQINAAGALAGSGPAFIYTVIEALADGAVKMGLSRALATAFASQTVKGAGCMVLQTGKHPAQLKDEVCSPGGTTIAGMHELEKGGLRCALISAVEASALRAKELA